VNNNCKNTTKKYRKRTRRN